MKQHRDDHDDLEHGDDALFDAIDEDALDGVDILEDAGHEVARRAVVKPAQRETLDVGIKVAAQVENDALLEDVVDVDAQGVEQLLEKEDAEAPQGQGRDASGVTAVADLVDHPLRQPGENDDGEGAEHGAKHHARGQRGVAFHVAEDPQDRAASGGFGGRCF